MQAEGVAEERRATLQRGMAPRLAQFARQRADAKRKMRQLQSRLEERLAESLRDMESIREQNSVLEAGGSLILTSERPGRSLRKADGSSVGAAAAASAKRRSMQPRAPPKNGTWSFPKFDPGAIVV